MPDFRTSTVAHILILALTTARRAVAIADGVRNDLRTKFTVSSTGQTTPSMKESAPERGWGAGMLALTPLPAFCIKSAMQVETFGVFCDLAQTHSLTATARHFGLTRNAVRRQLALLEREFKTGLAICRGKKIRLIREGRVCRRYGKRMVAACSGWTRNWCGRMNFPPTNSTWPSASASASINCPPASAGSRPRTRRRG